MKVEELHDIIEVLLLYAKEAGDDSKKNKNSEYYSGRKMAYYEVLETIQSRCELYDVDLGDIGLDVDLEKLLF